MNSVALATLRNFVENPQRCVIVTHHNPDADALGSSLGWGLYLQKKGHQVSIITPSEIPKNLSWMHGRSEVIEYQANTSKKAKEILASAEVIYCLDLNALGRVHELEASVREATAPKVMIDHHLQPEDFAVLAFSETTAAATAEIVYQLIVALGDEALLDVAIGEALYAGLMTDTGSFRHPSTTSEVHRVAAALIALGVNTNRIHRLIYDTNSLQRTRLLGYVLHEKLTILPEYKTAYIVLTDAELRRFHSQPGDTEGIVNYALSIEDVQVAVILIEREKEVKLSFRAVSEVTVNTFAQQYFNGGGHRNAAGGRSFDTLDVTLARLLQYLPELVTFQKP